MLQDALLAWIHYLAIFVLVVVARPPRPCCCPGLTPDTVRRLALYDRVYMFSALAVLATGLLRLTLAPRAPPSICQILVPRQDHALHRDRALFDPATLSFLRWQKQARQQPGFVPSEPEIRRARRWVMIESHLFILLPPCAVLMARGIGM